MQWNLPCIVKPLVSNLPYGCQEHAKTLCTYVCIYSILKSYCTISMADDEHYMLNKYTRHPHMGEKNNSKLV